MEIHVHHIPRTVSENSLMKNISIILILSIMILTGACEKASDSSHSHVGEKSIMITEIQYDSIKIPADSTSIRGNFVLMDTMLLFVDRLYCKIFPFSIYDGKPSRPIGGMGQGPGEMVGVICGSAISPADTLMWILDASNGVYEYSLRSGSIVFLTQLDFSWDKADRNNYESTSVYNTMQMTSFGVTVADMGNGKVLYPLSLVDQFLDEMNVERYKKGHILGVVDKNTLKVEKVIGSMASYYQDTPIPLFEFFDYAVNYSDSILYVSHAPDSLIYCYKYPDSLLYVIGFEPEGLHRDFTVGYDLGNRILRKEILHTSVNTGLYYDATDKLLFRTSITDYVTGNVVVQIYSDNNLIGEVNAPPFFHLLGRIDDRYYAVRSRPVETDDEEVYFILYSFSRLRLDN